MTPDELASLNEIGRDMVQAFAAITCETLLLTIYGVFALKSLLLMRHSVKQRARGYLLPITILTMFVMAIVLWTLDLANFIMEAKITLIETSDNPIDAKFHNALAFVFRLEAAQDVLYAFMTLLGDAIIIHRVWGLQAFSGRLWVLLVPCAILFGSLVTTVMLTVCIFKLGPNIQQENFNSPVCADVQIITYVMPSANTAIATGLVGLTAWKYRKSIAPILRDNASIVDSANNTKGTQIERILVLLVESGILYFLFFVIQLVFAGLSVPADPEIESLSGFAFVSKIYAYSCSVIVGLYPTILIVLARSKHNVLDRAAASSDITSAPSLRITRRYTDPNRDRTPTFHTIQIGARSVDEIELHSLHPLSQDDEEKVEGSSRQQRSCAG
ncbi:hypothetical protein K438DRAFT_1810641, partial [Mycena galopus ATCC 62051]